MIKFFRRIRQKLLSENKFSKYLLYAIGEIILVVIGILIALQINNWNENRKERESERQLLSQLKKDLQKNIRDLQYNMSLQEGSVQSAEVLQAHFESGLPFHDSLNTYFSKAFVWTKFVVNSGAYQTLKSHGVELISDIELRDQILTLYEGNLNWLEKLEATIIDHGEKMRVEDGYEFFEKMNSITFKDGQVMHGETKVIDYEELRTSTKFKYYLESFKNQNNILLNTVTKGYIDDHQRTIRMIEKELNKDSK